MNYAKAWYKSFQKAPLERRQSYGEKWALSHYETTEEGLQSIAADPQITVDALREALTAARPPTRMLTGNGAQYIFQVLSWLPDRLRDRCLYVLMCKWVDDKYLGK